jgi:hypothetical protein
MRECRYNVINKPTIERGADCTVKDRVFHIIDHDISIVDCRWGSNGSASNLVVNNILKDTEIVR